jgi:GAF domain-containing protein
VCGTSAAKAETVVVADVHAFPGHITCDGRSASEIVVPVFGPNRELLAVLDIDSEHKGTFDETDRAALEDLMGWFSRKR